MPTNPDLNPTPEARFAMWFFHREYGESRLGSMGFWNSLKPASKRMCRQAVREILAAHEAHKK